MLRPILLLLALPCAPLSAQVTTAVNYEIAFPNAVHHEARVTMTLGGVPRGVLHLRMSASSPGRYALTGFAKNVYDVSAVDGRGRPLTLTRPDPDGWDVTGHDGAVVVSYTVYGDRGDGTYLQVDATHAHLNMPATFMWARGFDARRIRIRFHPPEGSGWKIATQLLPTADASTFTAPGLQYFMDSPTELSDFTLRTWTVTSNGHEYTMRLALHHTGTEAEADAYAALARRVVDTEIAVFGETPAYEPGTYTFIADYLPWASGDGMEHRNSTIISSTGSLARSANGLIGTLSHEFFHSWNMERIRSRGIEPFRFDRANISGELWLGEGFTQYYGGLVLRRADITPLRNYVRGLAFTIDAVTLSPGRRYFSPVGMSQQAPWRDGAAVLDPTNASNIFISYYTWGSAIALGLDLSLRARGELTLDGFMRALWTRYGKTGVPYTLDGVEQTLATYSGDAAFARDFFARYVRGRDVPDYGPLLARAGLLLRPRAAGAPYLGPIQLDYDSGGAVIGGNSAVGSPFYDAGLDRDDRIVSLDGRALVADSVFQAVRNSHRPGDTIAVQYQSRGRTRTGRVAVIADPRSEVVTYEDAGLPVTAEMLALRRAWLGAER